MLGFLLALFAPLSHRRLAMAATATYFIVPYLLMGAWWAIGIRPGGQPLL